MIYDGNKNLTCINIWAGPGAGKSTSAAGLFYLMKNKYMNCELVSEYAKDLTWVNHKELLTEQDYIFAKQHHRLRRLVGKVNFAIIDSPLPLGLVYMPEGFPKTFPPFVMETFATYNNVNIRIKRVKPYLKVGRGQEEEEARKLDEMIDNFIDSNDIPIHFQTNGDENAPMEIFNFLVEQGIITMS